MIGAKQIVFGGVELALRPGAVDGYAAVVLYPTFTQQAAVHTIAVQYKGLVHIVWIVRASPGRA
jgi:hypothetical protein